MRGNVIDLAVGVVIGAAFTAVVTAFSENIINPLINAVGGADFSPSVSTSCRTTMPLSWTSAR